MSLINNFSRRCVLCFSLFVLLSSNVFAESGISEPLPEFSDFSVSDESIFTGTPAPAILSSEIDKSFKTRVKDAAKAEVNFAGHYTLSSWGCGSGCEQVVVVDAETGKTVWLPFFLYYSPTDPEVEEGLEYKKDSKLLIINAQKFYDNEKDDVETEESGYNRHYFKLEDGEFIQLKSLLVTE